MMRFGGFQWGGLEFIGAIDNEPSVYLDRLVVKWMLGAKNANAALNHIFPNLAQWSNGF